MSGRRRRVLATGLLLVATLVATLAVRAPSFGSDRALPALHATPDWYVPLDEADGRTNADNLAWLAAGRVPGSDTAYEPMVRTALLDLRRLMAPNGAVAAGPSDGWSYDWPRDTAFVAVALDRAGHRADALAALGFLARMQQRDGGFAARYLLDGSGVPDRRPRQADAAGWVLWALGELSDDSFSPAGLSPGAGRSRTGGASAATDLAPDLVTMAQHALGHLLDLTDDGTQLPPVTPDYWEVHQKQVSLGEVAPMIAGLDGAATLFTGLEDQRRAASARAAGNRLADVVVDQFGPTFQRYGDGGGRDAAVAMLMPAFVGSTAALAPGTRTGADIVRSWTTYQDNALRAGGGLAPGEWWYHVGESWTPETALVAYTAAESGRTEVARHWMDWLDAHRVPWGSLPEKVLADGRPAGAAPLAWTAALVVLTAAELDRRS